MISLKFLREILRKHFMKVYVTIFRTTNEVNSIWGEGKSMDSTEMPKNFCKRSIVNDVHQLDLESSLSCLCGCDISSILTSCKQNMELLVIRRIE